MRPPRASVANSAPVATSDFPEPVGVERMTFAPETSSISASLWWAYGVSPRASTQPVNASYTASGSGSAGIRSASEARLDASRPRGGQGVREGSRGRSGSSPVRSAT